MPEDKLNLSFKFEGPEVADNGFDAAIFGDALRGIGDLLYRTANLVNGNKTVPSVRIKANLQGGSFEFLIELGQDLVAALVPVLTGVGINAILNCQQLIQLLFGKGNGSLLDLLRFLLGVKPTKIEKKDNIVLVYKDETRYLEVRREAFEFFSDQKVRKAIGLALADSLSRPGIDALTIKAPHLQQKVLESEKASFYFTLSDEDVLDEETVEAELEIVGISFEKGRKWDFRSYKTVFSAEITDERFWEKVDLREEFQKGDRLSVFMKTEIYKTDQQLRKRRTILKVIAHKKQDKQISLDL
jgi:hypothetical protein